MSDPMRLLDGELDDFARALLRAEVDDPEHAARTARVLTGLGLDLPGPGGGEGDLGGAGGPGGPEATAGSGGSAAASSAGAVKAALAVGAVVTLGGLASLWIASAPGQTPPPELEVGVAPSQLPKIAPREQPESAPSASVPAAPEPPKPPATPAATPQPAQPKPPASSGLAQELLLLDRARAALASGDAAGADRALSQYEASYPRGLLAPEARTLRARIDAAKRQALP